MSCHLHFLAFRLSMVYPPSSLLTTQSSLMLWLICPLEYLPILIRLVHLECGTLLLWPLVTFPFPRGRLTHHFLHHCRSLCQLLINRVQCAPLVPCRLCTLNGTARTRGSFTPPSLSQHLLHANLEFVVEGIDEVVVQRLPHWMGTLTVIGCALSKHPLVAEIVLLTTTSGDNVPLQVW